MSRTIRDQCISIFTDKFCSVNVEKKRNEMFAIVHLQSVSNCMLYVVETLKQVPQVLT